MSRPFQPLGAGATLALLRRQWHRSSRCPSRGPLPMSVSRDSPYKASSHWLRVLSNPG